MFDGGLFHGALRGNSLFGGFDFSRQAAKIPLARGFYVMKPLPYAEAIARLAEEERGEGWLIFCERKNLYQLPVVEWLDALIEEISALAPETALEVGAGDAIIGKALQAGGVDLKLTDPGRTRRGRSPGRERRPHRLCA